MAMDCGVLYIRGLVIPGVKIVNSHPLKSGAAIYLNSFAVRLLNWKRRPVYLVWTVVVMQVVYIF